MAFHAEEADDVAAVLRYAPAAARRATALASHREAVAQFERALRFASGAKPVTVAGLYDELAAELTLLDRAEGSGRGLQARAGTTARGRRPAARRRYHPPALLPAVAPVPRRGIPCRRRGRGGPAGSARARARTGPGVCRTRLPVDGARLPRGGDRERPAVDRPQLPVRGRAGPAGRGRGGRAAGGAEHLHRDRRVRRGPAHPAAAARARRTVHPGRTQVHDPGDPLGLTRREREVLGEICSGQTNAAKLFISAKTVDHHVSAVLAKLGAPNRNAAAAQAAKLGLLS